MDKYADFLRGDVIKISNLKLKEMESIAIKNNVKKRYRICLHDSPENRQHEMLVCTTHGDYSRPHKHVNMSESHFIIEGSERIVIFDDEGGIVDTFLLDRSDGMLCYRINSSVYHMSIPLSDTVIELETKGGPFVPESNIWAPWAPSGNDCHENEKFVKMIVESIDNGNKTV